MIESAGCGVFVCYAQERLLQVLNDPKPTVIGWRKLEGPNSHPQWKKAVHEYAESLINTPYEKNFSDFVKAWIGESEWKKTVASFFSDGAKKGEDLDSLFCSELCAAIYKYGHLLEQTRERDSNAYAPKDFSSGSNASLNLQPPWALRTEVEVVTRLPDDDAPALKSRRGQCSTPNASGQLISNMVDSRSACDAAAANHLALQQALSAESKSMGVKGKSLH